MHQIKTHIIFMVYACVLSSCITPFEPEIETGEIHKIVVSGMVIDNKESQQISISMASNVSEPEYIPVSGCNVIIKDDRGNEFQMYESDKGIYNGIIAMSYLTPGSSYKVEIVTPEGIRIESDFDRMDICPDIDTIYYIRRDIITNTPGEFTKGIQFYLNLDGRNSDTRYFRWEIAETWEYHVPYPREWYYDGQIHHISPADYSRKICWSTEMIKNIFTLTTNNLSVNKYEMMPLHFVNNKSSKLLYGYSILINQFSMSEASYSYWDQLRINSSQQGGLYEKQPLTVTGNMHNISDPAMEVLGFFGASSVKSKRIFVKNVENLDIEFVAICSPATLRMGLIEISEEDFPAFLVGDERGFTLMFLSNECVDCLTLGGTNIKPDYWPD